MKKLIYQYYFKDRVSMESVESDLTLAVLAGESLFGEARVLLECDFAMDVNKRTLVIQAGNQVAQTVNTIFVGLVHRFIGEGCFTLKRIHPGPNRGRNRRNRRNPKKRYPRADGMQT